MMKAHPDQDVFISRVIEALGGKERARVTLEAEDLETERRWRQDTEAMGRVLRAHLFVEHYLTERIQRMNPSLGPVEKARLSFSQRMQLLRKDHPRISEIWPGIQRLNQIRNRLAHNLSVTITEEDVATFLGARYFSALRKELAKPAEASVQPLDILEEFARYAATILYHEFSALGRAIEIASKGEAGVEE